MAGDLLRDVADELEIHNLVARLAILVDTGDLDAYAALFTEDATWAFKAPPGSSLLFPALKGRTEILSGARKRRAEGFSGPETHCYHLLVDTSVTPDGDKAVATSYAAFVKDANTAPNIGNFAIYRDGFRRTSEGWRLASRTIEPG